ncbi:MAG: DNA repair protein RadC [Rhodocyclaceae bacterium]|nr:DNA repair protein RadC [Rhodocyclaceae bacterium]
MADATITRRRRAGDAVILRALSILGSRLREPGACLGSPGQVRAFLMLHLAETEHEAFIVLLLDAQNRLIEAQEMARGTLTKAVVHPREVVRAALRANAAGVILAHNHPSGVAEPSRADEALTEELRRVLDMVDVKLLDHFIVAGRAEPLSFRETDRL